MTAKPVHVWALVSVALSACAQSDPPNPPILKLDEQLSNTRSLLIGLSPVDTDVVWASGTGGTVVRTTNGGSTWEAIVVPGADTVQFRDIHADRVARHATRSPDERERLRALLDRPEVLTALAHALRRDEDLADGLSIAEKAIGSR